ncbi:MAG: HIT domain-containing protein [Candidatus Brocadiales bacterium]
MKKLWAPWRQEYILAEKKGCIFCRAIGDTDDAKNLVVYRGKECFLILNKYPYSYGHLMAAPNRHVCKISELNEREMPEIMRLIGRTEAVLREHIKPEGFNIGANIGKAAGAGEQHLHFHIVPRWVGDTNFMPVASETKVISQHLSELSTRLKESFRDQSL